MKKELQISDILIKGIILPINSGEIDSLEKKLNTKFPFGYRELICKFGEGWLKDFRIYPPSRILSGSNNINEWRKRIDEYWFWDEEPIVITKEKALECIIFADNINGDELIFHPNEPNSIYILFRDDEQAILIEGGIFKTLEWYADDEDFVDADETWTFESFQKS